MFTKPYSLKIKKLTYLQKVSYIKKKQQKNNKITMLYLKFLIFTFKIKSYFFLSLNFSYIFF